jgi:predicted dehydrogenase
MNQYQAPNEWTLTIVCTRGTVRFEYHHNRYRWLKVPDTPWQDESFGPLERDALFMRQAERFLDSLDGEPPMCSIAEAAQTLRTSLAILSAVDSRQWIEVESIQERTT